MKKGWIIALGLLLIGVLGAFIYYNRLKSNAKAEGGAYDGTLKPRVELSRFDFRNITDDEIRAATPFQEKFFQSVIIR